MKTRITNRLPLWLGTAVMTLLVFGTALTRPTFAQEPDQQEVRMYYSLYYEDFKNNNCEGALPNLRWMLKQAPGFPKNDDRNFKRARECYEKIAEAAAEPEMKRTYLDSVLYIFDTAVPTLKDAVEDADIDEADWLFDKGRFIQNRPQELPDLQPEVGSIYLQVYEMSPEKLQSYYVNYIIGSYVQDNDKEGAIDFMKSAEETYASDPEVTTLVKDWRGRLFTSPEERYEWINSQLETDPDNVELLRQKLELAQDMLMREDVYAVAEKLRVLDPSPGTMRLLAKMHQDDGEMEKALALYQQALEAAGPNSEYAREIYYNMGILRQEEGSLSAARREFRRALEADPNFGPALIAIGDLYVTAVSNCGSFEREDRAVYWLATDYFERARNADRSVANIAGQKINNIRRYYPTAEDKFFKSWNAGSRMTINFGCYGWISESTTIR